MELGIREYRKCRIKVIVQQWGRGSIALLHLVLAEELRDVSFLGEVNCDGVRGDGPFKQYIPRNHVTRPIKSTWRWDSRVVSNQSLD